VEDNRQRIELKNAQKNVRDAQIIVHGIHHVDRPAFGRAPGIDYCACFCSGNEFWMPMHPDWLRYENSKYT